MTVSGRHRYGPVIRDLGLGVLVVSIATVVIVRQAPIPADAAYIGSAACGACHQNEYAGWHASRHSKMMRRVDYQTIQVQRV